MGSNPYQEYKRQSVMTMTQSDMLTALYDGLLKELAHTKVAFASNNYDGINRSLQKVQSILRHLQGSLNFQYEISNSLSALYDYFIYTAIQANVKKNPSELDGMIEMIADLRSTYIEADKKARLAENGR